MVLYVTVGKNKAHAFPIEGTKTEDIVDYVMVANDKKAAFFIKYNIQVGQSFIVFMKVEVKLFFFILFQGEEAHNKWSGHLNSALLPAGWSCQQHGSASSGHHNSQGILKFQGPEKSKELAYQIAEKYYDGCGVTITWQMD